MLTENAVVIESFLGKAKVRCQSQTACGACVAKEACGTSVLSALTGEKGTHIFTIDTITPLKVGQIVEIGLPERSIILSALLIYLVPLGVLLITTLLSSYLFQNELTSAIFILFSTALSFVFVHYIAKKIHKKSAYQPILLRTLG